MAQTPQRRTEPNTRALTHIIMHPVVPKGTPALPTTDMYISLGNTSASQLSALLSSVSNFQIAMGGSGLAFQVAETATYIDQGAPAP